MEKKLEKMLKMILKNQIQLATLIEAHNKGDFSSVVLEDGEK